MIRLPPRLPLFPSTALFRSARFTHVLPTNRTRERANGRSTSDPVGAGATTVIRSDCTCRRLGLPISSVSVRNGMRSEEHTSELQSQSHIVCRLLLVNTHFRQ